MSEEQEMLDREAFKPVARLLLDALSATDESLKEQCVNVIAQITMQAAKGSPEDFDTDLYAVISALTALGYSISERYEKRTDDLLELFALGYSISERYEKRTDDLLELVDKIAKADLLAAQAVTDLEERLESLEKTVRKQGQNEGRF